MTIIYSYKKGEMPTAQDVTNFYLYGQKDKPADMLDPSSWGSSAVGQGGTIKVAIDYDTFISQVARFFDASSFELIRYFMGLDAERPEWQGGPGPRSYEYFGSAKEMNSTDYQNYLAQAKATGQPVIIKKADVADIYGFASYGLKIHQSEYAGNEPDYAERVFIWASQSFQIGNDTDFIIYPDGTHEIKNFSIEYRGTENFDFAGGENSNPGRPALQPVLDPSGIGQTVEFVFIGKPAQSGTITEQMLQNLYDNNNYYPSKIKNWPSLPGEIQKIVNSLFYDGDRPIAFLDANDKPIIYSGDNGSKIEGTKTGHTVDGTTVDIATTFFNVKFNGIPIPGIGLNNSLAKYVKNGITYVGGNGIDQIHGTNNNDIMYGHDDDDHLYGENGDDQLYGGNGSDDLYGGSGKDTYVFYVDDPQKGFDTIIDDSKGEGELLFSRPLKIAQHADNS